MPTAVSIRGLTKSFGSFQAVKGIDFDVNVGEVFGFLGPNGAGKSTTVESVVQFSSVFEPQNAFRFA